jgi:hypothetical protein
MSVEELVAVDAALPKDKSKKQKRRRALTMMVLSRNC